MYLKITHDIENHVFSTKLQLILLGLKLYQRMRKEKSYGTSLLK